MDASLLAGAEEGNKGLGAPSPYDGGDSFGSNATPSSTLKLLRTCCLMLGAVDVAFGIVGQVIVGGVTAKKNLMYSEMIYFVNAFAMIINWTLLIGILALWSALHWRHFSTLAYILLGFSQWVQHCIMFHMMNQCSWNKSSKVWLCKSTAGGDELELQGSEHNSILGVTVILFLVQLAGLILFPLKHTLEGRATSANNGVDLVYD